LPGLRRAAARARAGGPLKIGTAVDDANAALAAKDAQCAVKMPAGTAAYGKLSSMFRSNPGAAQQRHVAGRRARR